MRLEFSKSNVSSYVRGRGHMYGRNTATPLAYQGRNVGVCVELLSNSYSVDEQIADRKLSKKGHFSVSLTQADIVRLLQELDAKDLLEDLLSEATAGA